VIVFVDTSALIALLDAEDLRHVEASTTLDWLRESADLVTTNYVQVEALAVCRRRLGREAADALIDVFLPVVDVIWVGAPIHEVAVAASRSSGRSASFVDEVSFAVMRTAGIQKAFAYDDDFEREGFMRPVPPRQVDRVHEETAPYGDSTPDLVSVAEIAAKSGRSTNTVQSWRRRHADFPTPAIELAAGPIWNWSAIEAWLAARSRQRLAQGSRAGTIAS
jgi:predicted nucleic acid-binding protein